jgi:hypothetical protein
MSLSFQIFDHRIKRRASFELAECSSRSILTRLLDSFSYCTSPASSSPCPKILSSQFLKPAISEVIVPDMLLELERNTLSFVSISLAIDTIQMEAC